MNAINTIIVKIQKSLNIIFPIIILVLQTLGLTGAVAGMETWVPVVNEILIAIMAVVNVWAGGAQAVAAKAAAKVESK
jgi:hypothetical protein